jgi:hypothetical protein
MRHENNNSAWTQNHSLLDSDTLDEYLKVYRERTVWLSERFANSAAVWRYFEWSFMISMVEKITRLGLSDCYELCDKLKRELQTSRDEFVNSELTLNFEREWMEKYV